MINPIATPADEHDTEPQMPAVSGLLCWYCDQTARTYCVFCEVALCKDHTYSRQVKGKAVAVCDQHRCVAA